MISGQQVRAARALLGIDQKQLANLAGLSLPTVQRMEASRGRYGWLSTVSRKSCRRSRSRASK
ncbi:helix-turn-helix domain-containing protein [Brevundimonas fontaquae]|uniref:Helix-turn-helix transcriptional regulator n=1 Tax=Brevundimonas fontaquae TaxID=2813778 RepID=A0ABX7LTT9_9CAUL|nr:helix-turn-helix transcriptional regulator [Brevundimonas fontaquae]